ncbi:tRNA ligase subunit PheS family protein [Saccharothrix hoggarensis]|uniref:FDX-ACB domain-containing protein n=1 Tax=Saccharothrix hoggarensis TaxID=913853 RepID=A0ABW3R6C7_9PSEU
MPRDLSDPTYGPHAVQLLVADILAALPGDVRVLRDHPEVSVDDNYTALGYPPDAVTRDASYTRYTGPGRMLRSHTTPATHPYTTAGRQVDVLVDGEWLEVAECGLAARHVLRRAWLPDDVHGLALGAGLDRLLMLRKGVPDIRLLSSEDPRVAAQMLDLTPYRPVSRHPAITRDISVAVDPGADAETIGDAVRAVIGDVVEEVVVVSETPVRDLPEAAVARLGARPEQRNVLLRLVLRHLTRTLTDDEANAARDAAHAAVHQGDQPLVPVS